MNEDEFFLLLAMMNTLAEDNAELPTLIGTVKPISNLDSPFRLYGKLGGYVTNEGNGLVTCFHKYIGDTAWLFQPIRGVIGYLTKEN